MIRQTTAYSGLSTLEDISSIILQSHNLSDTLNNIVNLVAGRMHADVCCIYLLDEERKVLWLRAAHGLPDSAVGKVHMPVGQGLATLAIEERRPVSIADPQSHPRFLYFAETGEERLHCFLAIPLSDRRAPIGVITLQRTEKQAFTPLEISTLSTIAFQIATVVINAKLLHSVREQIQHHNSEPTTDKARKATWRGVTAYPGVVGGAAHILDNKCGFADIFDDEKIDVEQEIAALTAAIEKTRIQTLFLEKRVAQQLSEQDAAIFHTHLMILEDNSFIERMINEIRAHHCAPYALKKVIAHYTKAFKNMDDPYLRERATDTIDIGRRLLSNLTGQDSKPLQIKRPGILFAHEILPSEMATLDHNMLLGIVTESDVGNSHAVIMAKSLGIPALVGVQGVLQAIKQNDHVILDANSGCLFIEPSPSIIKEYHRLQQDSSNEMARLNEYRQRPAISKDGVTVTMHANIGLISDVAIARKNGVHSVGLYRTEFPYMTRSSFPDRNDQYQLYSKIAGNFDGPVTIRTLDIGGDKRLPYFPPPKEDNPFMGWRSVRVSLDNRDIFRTQIEAILMAGVNGNIKMLFPMISGIEEIRACKEVIAEAADNLRREEIAYADDIPVGMMVEVPAAVQMCRFLAAEVDFFALGTNDLVQYMLAADRNNPRVSKYYNPLHPAVLQAIKHVNDVATEMGKGVCLCGEMAADPLSFMVLLGIGIREFSLVSPFIPRIKAFLADLSCQQAEKTAAAVLKMGSSEQIHSYLIDVMQQQSDSSRNKR